MNDEELIARARQLAEDGVRSPEAQALARELLRQLADRLDGRADRAPRLGGGDGAPGLGGHRRWHVNRGEHNPDCRYCQSAAQAAEAKPPPI